MPPRQKPGNIAEVETENGLAYIQLIKKHDKMGHCIRVIDGLYETRPTDLAELAAKPTRFIIFFPFNIYIHRGQITLIGNTPLPPEHQKLPTFCSGNGDKNNPPKVWWL